jgi:hypothetical protein
MPAGRGATPARAPAGAESHGGRCQPGASSPSVGVTPSAADGAAESRALGKPKETVEQIKEEPEFVKDLRR